MSDHVDVASMSIGGAGGNPDDSMSLAVDNATFAGVLSTIAAGNTGPNLSTINSPGTARSAVTVAAACKPEQSASMAAAMGPSLWMAKFANGSTGVRLLPYYGTRPAAFLRQDFAFQDYDPVPYELTSNGAVVASGALPAFLATSSWPTLPFIGTATPGPYQFKISSFPYFNRGISLSAQVVATFDTTLSDPNPPSLTQMKYTTAGQRSDQHDSSTTNQLYFEMDAVGGSLSQVTASFSSDLNGVFAPLTLSASGGSYTANGSTVARRSTVTITAAASDNIGVTRVEFRINGALTCTDTATPFTCAWQVPNTKTTFSLQASAFDAAGNTANSTTVTVTSK